MVHPVDKGILNPVERIPQAAPKSSVDFENALQSASEPAASTATTASTATASELVDAAVQDFLNSYYSQWQASSPGGAGAQTLNANTSYQAASGAASNYTENSIYGPDQIYAQALDNQIGNAYASLTGENAAQFTSQLPGIPTQQAQDEFDALLAHQNALRLEAGQPIDTSAYWSDPGSVTMNGHTYTSQELGYAGAGQSSGPEPIYVSQANQVPGTNTFTVPGYKGTVSGIQPGRYYTLAQLEQAGLPTGQADAQIHPGSWAQVENA